MSATAQRKAWNDAMRTASGTSALPDALQPRKQKRRSDRRKTDRQNKARKTSLIGQENKEFLAAAWMDALEGVANTEPAGGDDDSYNESDEMDEKRKKRGRRGPAKRQDTEKLAKRFKPRSMANILLEEINKDDGVAFNWLEDEARDRDYMNRHGQSKFRLSARKFCPVTGMDGIYTEPKSGLPFANLKALEQVRERPPPWMILSGSIAYNEAVKSIRDEC